MQNFYQTRINHIVEQASAAIRAADRTVDSTEALEALKSALEQAIADVEVAISANDFNQAA